MTRSNFGSIQYISDGKYRVFWIDAPSPSKKKRKRHSKVVHGTRDDAEMLLALARIGQYPDGDTRYWQLWEAVVLPSLSELAPKTSDNYERCWNRELEPRIGDTKLSETDCETVEAVLAEIESAWVQRSCFLLWRKMFNMAKRKGLKMDNPLDRHTKRKRAVPLKRRYLDAEEIPAWLDMLRGQRGAASFATMAGGGLRPEEGYALDAEDISRHEFKGRLYVKVLIDKGLTSTSHGRHLGDPKNIFSKRSVIIGEPFASFILEEMPESGPLMPGKGEGEMAYLSPNTATRCYKALCESKGFPYVTPQKLRGSWKTMHSEAGSSDSMVNLTMGHSGGTTADRNYARATDRGMRNIADNLTDFIAEMCDNSD